MAVRIEEFLGQTGVVRTIDKLVLSDNRQTGVVVLQTNTSLFYMDFFILDIVLQVIPSSAGLG